MTFLENYTPKTKKVTPHLLNTIAALDDFIIAHAPFNGDEVKKLNEIRAKLEAFTKYVDINVSNMQKENQNG